MQTRTPLSIHRIALLLAASVATLAVAGPAHAAHVRAGTVIRNTATATFDNGGGGSATVTSNTVDLRVDEVLDVGVVSRDSGDASVKAGVSAQVRSFTVTNAGNGAEAFALIAEGKVGGNAFDPLPTSIVIDGNGNGIYEPGVDQVVGTAGATAELDPDATVTVFVLSSIPADAADASRADVRLIATARTGSGAAGTVFAGQGGGDGDAVVGATTARAFALGGFTVSRASVALTKTAVIKDPYGGARAVPGALITYRLSATLTGSGTVAGMKLADTIPDGTHYVAGSLTLDGTALSDATDADAGVASPAGISVSLGTPAAGSSHAAEFTVKID